MSKGSYIVITPVRNEEEFLPLAIESMRAQTLRPMHWAVVNDGSTDGTPGLLTLAAAESPEMMVIKREDRGFRLSGSGVIDAFYEGYNRIAKSPWRFLAKLDGDLSFEPSYFEKCIAEFDQDPNLGIGGGTICALRDQGLVPESPKDPLFHVRGAVKIYRRECWEAIDGLVRGPCWDSIDELKANKLGWKTRTLQHLQVRHHRPAGQAFGKWKDWVKGGRGNYVTGYHPLFMLLKCLSRLPRKPVGLAACGLLWGFLTGYFGRNPRLVDRDVIKFVRQQQLRFLTGRPSLWRESTPSLHAREQLSPP